MKSVVNAYTLKWYGCVFKYKYIFLQNVSRNDMSIDIFLKICFGFDDIWHLSQSAIRPSKVLSTSSKLKNLFKQI